MMCVAVKSFVDLFFRLFSNKLCSAACPLARAHTIVVVAKHYTVTGFHCFGGTTLLLTLNVCLLFFLFACVGAFLYYKCVCGCGFISVFAVLDE